MFADDPELNDTKNVLVCSFQPTFSINLLTYFGFVCFTGLLSKLPRPRRVESASQEHCDGRGDCDCQWKKSAALMSEGLVPGHFTEQ